MHSRSKRLCNVVTGWSKWGVTVETERKAEAVVQGHEGEFGF